MLAYCPNKDETMEVDVRKMDNTTIVAINGELDGKTAPEAQAKILPLAGGDVSLLIDMSQVGYMSSAGLRMMLLIYRQIGASGGSVALIGLTEEIEETMELTGFLSYFDTFDSVESAIEKMSD
jgi:anti-sigma B factor antagonist